MPALNVKAEPCSGVVYLTLDTGSMRHAEEIAAILRKHDVRATFFLANEKTPRGDFSLDASWAEYWKARAAEGHAFGTHTWRHGRINESSSGIGYRPQFGDGAGRAAVLSDAQFCAELQRVDATFRQYTSQSLDAVWRAPGGHVTERARTAAQACGYAHVRWAEAGDDEYFAEGAQVAFQQGNKNIKSIDVSPAEKGRKNDGQGPAFRSRFTARFAYDSFDPNAKTKVIVFFPDGKTSEFDADFSKVR